MLSPTDIVTKKFSDGNNCKSKNMKILQTEDAISQNPVRAGGQEMKKINEWSNSGIFLKEANICSTLFYTR